MNSYSNFRSIASVLLGGIAGMFIVIPITALVEGVPPPLPSLLGFGAGAFLGFRRRASSAFFYTALVAVLVLASLLTYSLSPNSL